VKDQHVVSFNAYWKTAQARPQIFVPAATEMRMRSDKRKPVAEGIHHAVGNLSTAALCDNVIPDVI
jgi:hypothetical protein